jgi:hypothetical protein
MKMLEIDKYLALVLHQVQLCGASITIDESNTKNLCQLISIVKQGLHTSECIISNV